jgi:hypothetical protein
MKLKMNVHLLSLHKISEGLTHLRHFSMCIYDINKEVWLKNSISPIPS